MFLFYALESDLTIPAGKLGGSITCITQPRSINSNMTLMAKYFTLNAYCKPGVQADEWIQSSLASKGSGVLITESDARVELDENSMWSRLQMK